MNLNGNMTGNDIAVHLPSEYFEALAEVLRTGLREANIKESVRKELKLWWDAESELIRDALATYLSD
jgi:hypothetical protein